MNGNSSKQVLLSVLGIAILVVAVVGVSFAFFSYTKTGSTTNVISTGQIYTYLTTGDTIALTNAMPVADPTEVKTTATLNTAGATDVGALTFSVTGINQSDTEITYKVYLIAPTAAEIEALGKTGKDLIDNSDVGILMSATGTGAMDPITYNSTTPVTVKTLLDNNNNAATLSDGALLGTGHFAAHTDTEISHSYTINMWVRGATVKISDTDASVNGVTTKYCAHAGNTNKTAIDGTTGNTTDTQHGCEQNLPIWSDSYYAVKVRVVANTNATNTGVNYNGN